MNKTYKIIFTGDMPFDEEDLVFTNKKEAVKLCAELNKVQKSDNSPCACKMSMKDFLECFEHFEVVEN